MSSKAPPNVLYEKSGGIATLTINRPDSRNAVTMPTAVTLFRHLQAAANDTSVRALVLRGQGADFCCGADIKAGASGAAADVVDPPVGPTHYFEASVLLHEMPAVTIAAIKGGCAGAGFGWAAACDLRVADPSAVFNTAFLDVAVAGDMGAPWLLPRIIGSSRARDLFFFPRKVRAQEAKDIGLVDRLFPAESFEKELKALTDRLDAAAPLALAGMKRNFVEAERMDLKSFIELESLRHAQLFASKDRVEAFHAFLEKRPARFQGK